MDVLSGTRSSFDNCERRRPRTASSRGPMNVGVSSFIVEPQLAALCATVYSFGGPSRFGLDPEGTTRAYKSRTASFRGLTAGLGSLAGTLALVGDGM